MEYTPTTWTPNYVGSRSSLGERKDDRSTHISPPASPIRKTSHEVMTSVPPSKRHYLNADAPLLHFSSGTNDQPLLCDLADAYNRFEYDYFRVLLQEKQEQLPKARFFNLAWVIDVTLGYPSSHIWQEKARRYLNLPRDHATFVENLAFEAMIEGDWEQAQKTCRAALDAYPTSEGFWVNLLVATTHLEQTEAVEEILSKLHTIVDVERGFLGTYLRKEMELRRPVCCGG